MATRGLEIKVPPHSMEMEKSVLGALLLDRDAVVAVVEFYGRSTFMKTNIKVFFGNYRFISGTGTGRRSNGNTAVEETKGFKGNRGGAEYLAELVNRVPTAAHAESYARTVKDLYTKDS